MQIALDIAQGLAYLHKVYLSLLLRQESPVCQNSPRASKHRMTIMSPSASKELSSRVADLQQHLCARAGTDATRLPCVGLQEKYVHRDITSGNVLLRDAGHACLADFGLAHQLLMAESTVIGSAMQADSILMGTFGYMAPEYTVNQGALQRDISAHCLDSSPCSLPCVIHLGQP